MAIATSWWIGSLRNHYIELIMKVINFLPSIFYCHQLNVDLVIPQTSHPPTCGYGHIAMDRRVLAASTFETYDKQANFQFSVLKCEGHLNDLT